MKSGSSPSARQHPFGKALWLKTAGIIAFFGILTAAAAAENFQAEGEQATGAVCANGCHGWEAMFDGPRREPREWDYIIGEMIGLGAYGTDEQLGLVSRYLSRSWGLLPINSASAEEIATVLAVAEADAAAVVAYREENGQFTDLDSLKKVPGIDAATIDAQVAAITFN